MNIFRFCGDMSHLFSIIILLLRLRVAKNAQGVSVKTHELYLLVFVTRYLDLFTTFYSAYNSIMKIVYIAATAAIIFTIKFQEPIKSTYEKGQDSFLHWQFAGIPCAVLAFLIHLIGSGISKFNFMELLWTFFDPSRMCHYHASVGCLATLPRSGEPDGKLRLFHGCLPSVIHSELDLQSQYGEGISPSLACVHLWGYSDVAVCGFLLLLSEKQSKGWKVFLAYQCKELINYTTYSLPTTRIEYGQINLTNTNACISHHYVH